jgi:hypothetical protein
MVLGPRGPGRVGRRRFLDEERAVPWGAARSRYGVYPPCHRRAPRLDLPGVSTLAVILIVIGAVVVLLLVGGLVAGRRYRATHENEIDLHIAEADRALEHARAADKGWDRAILEAAARAAIEGERPGWPFEELALVLVDDRPGIEQDRAHFVASGSGDVARVVLSRTGDGWALERIE